MIALMAADTAGVAVGPAVAEPAADEPAPAAVVAELGVEDEWCDEQAASASTAVSPAATSAGRAAVRLT
jgi:hypothetical protein